MKKPRPIESDEFGRIKERVNKLCMVWFSPRLTDKIRVIFDKRMTKTYGKAFYSKEEESGLIVLSHPLWVRSAPNISSDMACLLNTKDLSYIGQYSVLSHMVAHVLVEHHYETFIAQGQPNPPDKERQFLGLSGMCRGHADNQFGIDRSDLCPKEKNALKKRLAYCGNCSENEYGAFLT